MIYIYSARSLTFTSTIKKNSSVGRRKRENLDGKKKQAFNVCESNEGKEITS